MAEQITNQWIITCDDPAGGELDLYKDGEAVHKFHVPPGRHRASLWTAILGQGEEVRIGKACVGFPPRSGLAVSRHPLAMKSDANPSFEVTSATRMARQAAADLNAVREARLQIQAEARRIQALRLAQEETIPDPVRVEPTLPVETPPAGEAAS